MHRLRRFLQIVDALSDWSGKVPAFLVIGMVLIIAYEVVLRYVFREPTNWAHETAQMLFGAYIIIGGAYVLRWKGHIAMDLFSSRWSPRTRAIVDVITSSLFFCFCGALLYTSVRFAWKSLSILEHSMSAWGPPEYPLKLVIPIAVFLLLIQGVAKLTRDLSVAIKGKESE